MGNVNALDGPSFYGVPFVRSFLSFRQVSQEMCVEGLVAFFTRVYGGKNDGFHVTLRVSFSCFLDFFSGFQRRLSADAVLGIKVCGESLFYYCLLV